MSRSAAATPSDARRKLVHVGFGLFAVALRWLSWPVAAGCALAALLCNLLLLPKIGRGIYRDPERRHDPGIIAYPAMVLALILLYRHHLEVAAAVWGMMAFGDPAAAVAGRSLGGPGLPWNERKTWAGSLAYLAVGGTAAALLYRWVGSAAAGMPWGTLIWLVGPAALAAAFLESYPTGIDDNWITPLPASLLVYASSVSLLSRVWAIPGHWLIACCVNLGVAVATGLLGIVGVSGAIAGGIAGTIVLAFGGWPFYAVLWAFFLAGTLATKLGYREKLRRGTAQSRGGRRGAEHVIANCGVGGVLCLLFFVTAGPSRLLLAVGFAASFAAALADTFGTEFGSLYGRTAFSLTRFRRVQPGTRGAVSLAGTVAGLAGGLAIGALAAAARVIAAKLVVVIGISGLAGSLVESLVLDLAERRAQPLDHEFVNALNTLAGALIAMEITLSLSVGRVVVPFPDRWSL